MLICLALTWFSDCLMIFYLTLNLDSTSLRRNVFWCKHITQGIKDFDFIKLLVPPRWRPGTPKFKFCPKSMIEKTLRKIPPLLEPLDVTERECLTVSAVNSWEFQNIQDGDLIDYISISSSPSCGQSLVHAGKEIRWWRCIS